MVSFYCDLSAVSIGSLTLLTLVMTAQGNMLEVGADIGVAMEAGLQFSAGKQGQFMPVNQWIAKLMNVKNSTGEDADFASKFLYFLAVLWSQS